MPPSPGHSGQWLVPVRHAESWGRYIALVPRPGAAWELSLGGFGQANRKAQEGVGVGKWYVKHILGTLCISSAGPGDAVLRNLQLRNLDVRRC